MSPDNPFLQALLAEPDDDTLRLAMADWFDENDQPERAEFIRVQIELAQNGSSPERRRQLEIRQRDLLIAHDTEWVQPLAAVLACRSGKWGGWVFRRGFVEYFHLPATVINLHGAKLAQLTPVRELFLRPVDPIHVATLCKRSWVRSLTHIRFDGLQLTDIAAQALINSPYLDHLRGLSVTGNEMSPSVKKRFCDRFPFAQWNYSA